MIFDLSRPYARQPRLIRKLGWIRMPMLWRVSNPVSCHGATLVWNTQFAWDWPLRRTPNTPISGIAACAAHASSLQPTLGVSSLDLGRSSRAAPSFAAAACCPIYRHNQRRTRSAPLTYASTVLLQCNRNHLPIVRRTSKLTMQDRRRSCCPPWAFPP
jgi:hypothetical protein